MYCNVRINMKYIYRSFVEPIYPQKYNCIFICRPSFLFTTPFHATLSKPLATSCKIPYIHYWSNFIINVRFWCRSHTITGRQLVYSLTREKSITEEEEKITISPPAAPPATMPCCIITCLSRKLDCTHTWMIINGLHTFMIMCLSVNETNWGLLKDIVVNHYSSEVYSQAHTCVHVHTYFTFWQYKLWQCDQITQLNHYQ